MKGNPVLSEITVALPKTQGRLALKGVVVNKTNETGFNCEFLSAADN